MILRRGNYDYTTMSNLSAVRLDGPQTIGIFGDEMYFFPNLSRAPSANETLPWSSFIYIMPDGIICNSNGNDENENS